MGTRGQRTREGEETTKMMLDILDDVCEMLDCRVSARTLSITAINTYLDNSEYEEGDDKPTRVKVLEEIKRYHEIHGVSPTVRELGDIVGLKSSSTVYGHLKRLQKKGKITWKPSMPRSIRVL